MKSIKLATIKPQTGEIEYGVWQDGHFLVHGIVIQCSIEPLTTLSELEASAAADAQLRGLL